MKTIVLSGKRKRMKRHSQKQNGYKKPKRISLSDRETEIDRKRVMYDYGSWKDKVRNRHRQRTKPRKEIALR